MTETTQQSAVAVEQSASARTRERPSPRRLVVLVPGFRSTCSAWKHLKVRLERDAPGFSHEEAVWLDFDHHASLWKVGTFNELATRLNERIIAEWIRAGGFDEIVLVGHSMGGLIIRQTYLLAAGATPGERGAPWANRVIRIVLLASPNRGIKNWKSRLLEWITRILPGLPHLCMQDVIRGSNFLTNLRINWIRHFGARVGRSDHHEQSTRSAPLVVQLLGSDDGIVRRDDSKDVLAFASCHYLGVPDANHSSLFRVELAPDPDLRFAVLKHGFSGDFPAGLPEDELSERKKVKRVVFILHGIRTTNGSAWMNELACRIKARDPEHTIVRHPDYGYFTAARFALPSVRRKYVRTFQDWYTETLAEYPDAEFNVIAHSNGSYILGYSLDTTPGMKFANVVLAGSVLPCIFKWSDYKMIQQVVRVRNDRANHDWPVALLCNALRGVGMKDVGTAGFDGFRGHDSVEVAYYPGGHSVALRPEYQESLVEFVFGKDGAKPATLRDSPGYFRQLSNLMPYLAVGIAILAGGTIAYWAFDRQLLRLIWSAAIAIGLYVVLDIL